MTSSRWLCKENEGGGGGGRWGFVAWEHLQRCSVCDLAKIFFTSKFSYVLFCNPTNKTETGTANRWGTTNSKPSGPIIMIGQSEMLSSSSIIFISLFSVGAHHIDADALLTGHSNLCNYAQPKPFSWVKSAYVGFCSSNFTVQDHILSQHRWRCSKYLLTS